VIFPDRAPCLLVFLNALTFFNSYFLTHVKKFEQDYLTRYPMWHSHNLCLHWSISCHSAFTYFNFHWKSVTVLHIAFFVLCLLITWVIWKINISFSLSPIATDSQGRRHISVFQPFLLQRNLPQIFALLMESYAMIQVSILLSVINLWNIGIAKSP